jgi:hypothetical protein
MTDNSENLTRVNVRITRLKRRIEQAQRRIRRYIKPGRSLADDLIAKRREAAKRE